MSIQPGGIVRNANFQDVSERKVILEWHPWLEDLKLTQEFLEGNYNLPHTIMCDICFHMFVQSKRYKKEQLLCGQ